MTQREFTDLLQCEPIEDGYVHPAEHFIEECLKSSQLNADHWISATYEVTPLLAASVLRLLGRFPSHLVGEWGLVMAMHGLSHREIDVREAAVRALERWGGDQACEALKARIDAEPTSWLAAYMTQVIKDVSMEQSGEETRHAGLQPHMPR